MEKRASELGKQEAAAMIRPLRQRHLVMMTLLAILVPLVLVAALTARSAVPLAEAIPGSLVSVPPERSDGWYELAPDIPARVRIRQEKDGWKLDYLPVGDPEKPDLLLYWSASPADGSGKLAADAILLGSLAGAQARTFPVEEEIDRAGYFIVYSLAHAEVVGSAAVPGERD
jgi:hypothetical protein